MKPPPTEERIVNEQERQAAKSLLQYMADKCLTGSDQFRTAIKRFNVIVTCNHDRGEFFGTTFDRRYIVDVFSPLTIDAHPNGVRYEFATAAQADEFSKKERRYGDPRPPCQLNIVNRQRLERGIIEALSLHHRIFSRKQIGQYVKDAQETYALPDDQCEVAIDNLMNWQRNRIAIRATVGG